MRLLIPILLSATLLGTMVPPAHADTPVEAPARPSLAASIEQSRPNKTDRAAEFASGTGTVLYLATGTFLPLVTDGKGHTQRSLRVADSVITSVAISETIKRIVREKRPDNSDDKSFPSTHATAAFAAATMQSHYHPKQSLLWYGGAALISASRVRLRKHHWHDVIAGAALGYAVSKIELNQSRGLLLRPLIRQRSASISTPVFQMQKAF